MRASLGYPDRASLKNMTKHAWAIIACVYQLRFPQFALAC